MITGSSDDSDRAITVKDNVYKWVLVCSVKIADVCWLTDGGKKIRQDDRVIIIKRTKLQKAIRLLNCKWNDNNISGGSVKDWKEWSWQTKFEANCRFSVTKTVYKDRKFIFYSTNGRQKFRNVPIWRKLFYCVKLVSSKGALVRGIGYVILFRGHSMNSQTKLK